jgi:hypothetical protein
VTHFDVYEFVQDSAHELRGVEPVVNPDGVPVREGRVSVFQFLPHYLDHNNPQLFVNNGATTDW